MQTTTSFSPNFDPAAADAPATVYDWFAWSRRELPVFRSDVLDAWVVTRHDDVEQLLTDTASFSATVGTAPFKQPCAEALAVLVAGGWKHRSPFSSDAPDHTRFRSLISKVFTPKRIAPFEAFIADEVEAACDRMEGRDPVDVVAELCYPVPGLTILRLLGFPRDYLATMKEGSVARLRLAGGGLPDAEQVAAAHQLVDSWHFAANLVQTRLTEPGDDLLSDILAVRNGDDAVISLDELTSMLLTFFNAGHETTTFLLTNALLHLLSDRTTWAALLADPGLAANAIDETLRIDPPVYTWRRLTKVDTTVGGVEIPAGQIVFAALGSGSRDATVFPEPDRFDIHRKDARNHFAFGKGAHYCLGSPLARMEGRIALEGLTRRFPGLRLEDVPLNYLPSPAFHSPQELWVRTGRS